jgi:hypothetical protein
MDTEEREYLEELRRVHRKNLYRLNLQKAQHSIDVPAILINGIEYEEKEIGRIDAQLKQGGITNNFYVPKDNGLRRENKVWLYLVGGAVLLVLSFLLGTIFQNRQSGSTGATSSPLSSTSINGDTQLLRSTITSAQSTIALLESQVNHAIIPSQIITVTQLVEVTPRPLNSDSAKATATSTVNISSLAFNKPTLELPIPVDNGLTSFKPNVILSNFVVSADFYNPNISKGTWSYGFSFRDDGEATYILTVGVRAHDIVGKKSSRHRGQPN